MDRDPETIDPMLPFNDVGPGRKLRQYAAATSVSLGAVCAGTCLAWTSPALAQLSLPENTTSISPEDFYLTSTQSAAVGGMIAIGGLISAIPAGLLADKFGRKPIIIAISVSFFINWLLIVCAQNAITITIGRVFGGMGTGAICVAGPIYIGEIAEPALRGTLGAFINMFLCLGILITCIFGSFTSWRVLSGILGLIPFLFGGSFVFMPETPPYLLKNGKKELAREVLASFRGAHHDVDAELKEIQRELDESHEKTGGFKDIFRSRANRKAFFSVVGVLAFQQLCGVNAVVFYTVPIFKAAGSSLSPDLTAIIVSMVQVTSAYVSALVIEKANRKFFLMMSSAGMFLFLIALALYFHMQRLKVDITNMGFIPIGSAILFMIFFSFGFGPVPWMLMGELFAPEIKGVGNGFAISTNWACAFLITYFFPIISATIGAHVAFYICAGIMAFATLYVYFVVPETRGLTLLEIQHRLNR